MCPVFFLGPPIGFLASKVRAGELLMSISRNAATEVVMDEMEERRGMATEQILQMGVS